MKFQIKINIPDSILKAIFLIGIGIFLTLVTIAVIDYYEWLDSATCDVLIEMIYGSENSIAVKHSLEVKLTELECWK